jgi:hypothetical protein
MSDFKFACPHCSQHLEAPLEMIGTAIDCPLCSKQIRVPQPLMASQNGERKVNDSIAQRSITTPQQVKMSKLAVASLLLTTVGLVLWLLGPIAAIICGHLARSGIKRSGGALKGDGVALAGLIIGYFCVAGLVASLLLQAVSQTKKEAKVTQAHVEAKKIQQAVKAYYTDNNKLPDSKGNVALIKALTGANPRQIAFLEVAASSLKDGTFVDPWAEGYAIELDSDYDNSVTVGDQPVRDICAVWSFGPNRKDEKGIGDDITSWR